MRFAGTVVLYNPEDSILENVKTYLPFLECLYVMDNSTKKLEVIDKLKTLEKVKYISLNGNRGIAKALKVATETAIADGYDIFLSMDQDSKFPTEDFEIIKNYFMTQDISNVGFVCINYSGNRELDNNISKTSYVEITKSITSGTFMVLENYKKISGYNEDLFIDFVDHDICCQFYEKDIKMICFNNIILNHRLGEPEVRKFLCFKKLVYLHSPLRYYYMYRNFNYLKNNNSKKYKKILKDFNSRFGFLSVIYRMMFANQKKETYKMIRKGIKDGKNGVLGPYRGKKKEKILVTGVAGQLGYDIVRELKERGYENVIGIDRDELDITNEKDVHSFIQKLKPDIIMHNAAWTAVDKAEEMKEACHKVNVLGTKYMAESAQKVGSKLVYISTDYVFNGKGENFFEVDDEKEPLSYYGKTKYEGELEAQKCDKHFIVRISWAFGVNGHNFVKTMLKLAETKKELNIVCDQIGSPTYTYDLSKLLCDMIETEKYGIYHATNEGECSWSEFAKKIFEIAGANVKVNPVTTDEYLKLVPQQAIRPLNSRMSKESLDKAGFNRLPSWEDALERYIKEILEYKKEK